MLEESPPPWAPRVPSRDSAGRQWLAPRHPRYEKLSPERAVSLSTPTSGAFSSRYGVANLHRDGLEGAILKPLAQYHGASMYLVQRIRTSDDYTQRKIAVTIVGFLGPVAPVEILDELFEAESVRDRAPRNDGERFETQSVVEDIVFAATRWCRHGERRDAGIALLRQIVERTLSSEYWNTSSYAMTPANAPIESDVVARREESSRSPRRHPRQGRAGRAAGSV
jgi:hypothetical protein